MLIWLDVPKDIVKRRRMRTKKSTEEEYEGQIWPNHEKYVERIKYLPRERLALKGTESRYDVCDMALQRIEAVAGVSC